MQPFSKGRSRQAKQPNIVAQAQGQNLGRVWDIRILEPERLPLNILADRS